MLILHKKTSVFLTPHDKHQRSEILRLNLAKTILFLGYPLETPEEHPFSTCYNRPQHTQLHSILDMPRNDQLSFLNSGRNITSLQKEVAATTGWVYTTRRHSSVSVTQ
jgi:hypothetical protein